MFIVIAIIVARGEKVSQNNPEHQEEDKNKDPFAPNLDFRAAMDMFEEGDF